MLPQFLRRFLLAQSVQRAMKPGLMLAAELLDARGQITFANLEFIPVCMGAMAQRVSHTSGAIANINPSYPSSLR